MEETAKAKRKRLRREDANRQAKVARYWWKPGSAERLGHDRPINRQAAKELTKPK